MGADAILCTCADIAHQIQLTHDMMKHWSNILPEGRIMDVPYEALVANQEATSRDILKFVGLPWEPGVLKFHETIRSVQTASLGQVTPGHPCSAMFRIRADQASMHGRQLLELRMHSVQQI